MKKRLLAWMLFLSVMVGMMPLQAMAVELETGALSGDNSQMQVEQSTVSVEYKDDQRSAATITYHKDGIAAEPYNLIFLVDTSRQGINSSNAFQKMMIDNGMGYIFDYDAASTVQVISYENTVKNSSIITYKYSLSSVISGLTNGEGTANESAALDAAIRAVQNIHSQNDYPTVVFWVLGEKIVKPEEEIEPKLQELTSELNKGDDALVTWQYADQPNALLAKYATQHNEAHDDPSEPKQPAAHAANNTVVMQEGMGGDLEELVHDHYHNIHFSLLLDDAQTIVTKITNTSYEASSSIASLTAIPREDGKGLDVTIERLCRQIELDFMIEVELDTNVFEKQIVIPAGAIIADHEGNNGGLHTGLFDEQIEYGLELDLPAAEVDRTPYTITFQGVEEEIPSITKQHGETVTLPVGDGITQEGASFGGWNVVSGVNSGRHYSPGEIIAMPAGNMVLEPAFGHVEVDLDIDYEDGEIPEARNQMMDYNAWYSHPLEFLGVTLPESAGGGTVGANSIVSVSFIDAEPIYNTIPEEEQTGDPRQVELLGVDNVVYARHIGATIYDKVVAYLIRAQDEPDKYDMYVAGPGGVKAPEDSYGLLRDYSEWSSDRDKSAFALTKADLSGLDTSGMSNMSNMFSNCSALTELDVSNFDTSSVQYMSAMFTDCSALTKLDVSNFDTSSVTSMSSMFSGCSALTELTLGDNFVTSRVQYMSGMFSGCSALTELDVSNFVTSSVYDMGSMFYGCSALTELDISNFVTSSMYNMSYMFSNCSALTELDVSNFDTSSVINMNDMFYYCSALTELDVSNFVTSRVTNMSYMFRGCSALTELDVSNFVTSNVTDMNNMFSGCSGLTELDVSNFDTSRVTDMYYMFNGCSGLTELDLRNFNTSSVTDIYSMFRDCSKLRIIQGSFDISRINVTFNSTSQDNMDYMFYKSTNLEQIMTFELGTSSSIEDFNGLFYGLSKLKSVTFITPDGGTEFPKLSSMEGMFRYCSSLTTVELGNWRLPDLTNTSNMFYGCSNLNSITLRWSGINAQQDDFSIDNMFKGVPEGTLESGMDNSLMMEAIRQAFVDNGGSVTQEGEPWSPASNEMITEPELPEEEPGLPEEEPGLPPDETPDETPDQTPDETPDVTPDETPDQTPDETPDQTPDETPDQTPDETPDQTPDETPDVTPDETPDVTPDETPDVTPDETPDVTPDETPDVTPDETPDQTPDVTPDNSLTDIPISTTQRMSAPPSTTDITETTETADTTDTTETTETTDNSSSLPILQKEVNDFDTVTYKVTVKYVGDVGVQSGRITLNFPIPEDIRMYVGSNIPDDEYQKPGWYVSTTEIRNSGAPTGYMGGRVVQTPDIITLSDGSYALQGVFEGLFTGTEVTVSLMSTVQPKDPEDYVNGYAFWDGTAYATDGAGTAASQTVRLWNYKDGEGGGETDPTPPPTSYRLSYSFSGDVPDDVQLPEAALKSEGDSITAATVPEVESHDFVGWYRSDAKEPVAPGETIEMPPYNLTLTGKWTIKDEYVKNITVKYEYTDNNDGEHIPVGAPDLPETQQVQVGKTHFIQQITQDASRHKFGGWVPTLNVDGMDYPLTEVEDGIYLEEFTGITIDISSGKLDTSQFSDFFYTGDEVVTVTFSGAWTPYKGTIRFDANSGTGDMDDMTNVTWDTTEMLTKNQFDPPYEGYRFMGWATTPTGSVVRADGASAANLIDQNGKIVTLYAVWKRNTYGVGYNLSHVKSSTDTSEVSLGGNYSTTLTVEDGYEMSEISITMSGIAITNQVYDPTTGKVFIENITGNILITAKAAIFHTVRVSVTNGTASPSGEVRVQDGKNQTITFTPNTGYVLDSVTVDGNTKTLTGNKYVFTNVTGDHSISVVYKKGSGTDGDGSGGTSSTDKYPIHVDSTGNGNAAPNKDKAAAGEKVTITTDGTVDNITVTDKDGNQIPVIDNGDGSYTFEMPKSEVTVKVDFEPLPDAVDPDTTGVSDWLNTKDHLTFLTGYDTGLFAPDRDMTRAEVAQMFYNLLLNKDVPITASFADVPEEAWYTKAVNTLASLGIVQGVGDGKFDPQRSITRAEFSAIAMRFTNGTVSGENIFSDVTSDDWFYDNVVGSTRYGWITGYSDGTFRPDNTITRAEVTTITNRMLGRSADEHFVNQHSEELRVFPDVSESYWAYYQIVEATNSHDYMKDGGNETWQLLN